MRTSLKIISAVFALIVVAVAVQYCVAYVRTPGIVDRAEHAGLPVQLSDIRPDRLQWLIEVEDPRFYTHHGVDWVSPGAGYTSITQGLVKGLFYDAPFKPGVLHWRKLQQTIIAMAFNARVPKDEQLRLALNLDYMGTHDGRVIKGFSQASLEFFGKDLKDLSDDEFLSLVAVLAAPSKFSPAIHPSENQERVRRIHRLVAGKCKPLGVADVEYIGCAQ